MVPFQRMSIWAAAVFAVAGSVGIGAFLLIWTPAGYLLSGAAAAAVLSVVSLLAGVVFVSVGPVSRRAVSSTPDSGAAPSGANADSPLSAQFQQRREVLSERLNIDEPQYCTHAQATCTSWSFCGTAPKAGVPEGQEGEVSQDGSPKLVLQRVGKPAACLALVQAGEPSGPSSRPRAAKAMSATHSSAQVD